MDTDQATAEKLTPAKGDKAKATGENTPETTTEVTMETGQESGKKDDTVTKQIENNKMAELHVSDTELDKDISADDHQTGGKRKKGSQTKPKKPQKTTTRFTIQQKPKKQNGHENGAAKLFGAQARIEAGG
ncbi:Hypothetical predicted protein [Paramuricea clavata]|uniref:Uncharacterized protein n=1 Tax=Paramuricea clavata TaxID=317549 RepID=A0A7D9ENL6_PARCT|nr:Hypothetical predicted protein [Paramuricea clavata]